MENYYLVFTLNGKEIASYTIYGTFPGEKQATIEYLAYEHNCKEEDIKTHVEERTKMIKIYKEKDFSKELIESIKNDPDIWNFPLEELDYLLEEHENESFILINNRLYEMEVN